LPVVSVEWSAAGSRETLKRELFQATGLIRISTKQPGQPADGSPPVVLPRGSTVEDLAGKIHRDLAGKIKSAKIWPQGQPDFRTVGKDGLLNDRDLVELQT
jgi:hypothetical protein